MESDLTVGCKVVLTGDMTMVSSSCCGGPSGRKRVVVILEGASNSPYTVGMKSEVTRKVFRRCCGISNSGASKDEVNNVKDAKG